MLPMGQIWLSILKVDLAFSNCSASACLIYILSVHYGYVEKQHKILNLFILTLFDLFYSFSFSFIWFVLNITFLGYLQATVRFQNYPLSYVPSNKWSKPHPKPKILTIYYTNHVPKDTFLLLIILCGCYKLLIPSPLT
jgi:hypothetical protein